MTKPFKLSARLNSFRHAGTGFIALVRREHNARIHLAATIAAAAAGLALGLSAGEWTAIVLAIAMVWVAEAFNTAIEAVCDAVHPDRHPGIGAAKDIAAFGVLASAAAAALVGALVLLPRLV